MEAYKEQTIACYNENVDELAEKFQVMKDLLRRKEFTQFLESLQGKKILDLGCGDGSHALYFKEQGYNVTCIDLSDAMLDLCKQKELHAIKMDIEDLQFSENSFDGIWAVTSLLHVPKQNVPNVLKKLNSILKDKGILYICVKEGQGEGMKQYKQENLSRFFAWWQLDELLEVLQQHFTVLEHKREVVGERVFLEIFLQK